MLNKTKYSSNSSNTNCVCCLSEDDRIQLERSRKIDRDLAALKRRFRATQKIVLLGAGESGKSTFLKQMQIIHGTGFTYDDKLFYRTQIYENVIKGMAGLISGKRDLQLPWRGKLNNSNNSSRETDKHHHHNSSSPADIANKMRQIIQEFSNVYKKLIEDREQESNRLNRKVNITPEQFQMCVDLVLELWNDDSIREAYERRREYPKYFVENVPYLIDNLDRIARKDYLPDTADILRSRRATTGINEIEMDIKNVPFRFVDVGGQRTQRQKWHQCFSDVTAILFLASSSEYDEYLREDGQTNRLEESCKVFETLINYKYLRNVEFILFLNKHDLLKEKIQRINIKNYCNDFVGNPTSITDVENYLIKRFVNLKHTNHIEYNNNNTNSRDTQQQHQQQRQYLNQQNRINYTSNQNNRNNFDSLDFNTTTNNNNNNNEQQPLDKSIYSHFTTAIDTNNIKTIFEMVRLMIFEKNCKAIMLN